MTLHKVKHEALPGRGSLYEELLIKTDISVDGVDIDRTALEALEEVDHQEQVHSGFEMDMETHVGLEVPSGFDLPLGLKSPFKWSRKSDYGIAHDKGEFILLHKGNKLFPISFFETPKYYRLKSEE